MGKPLTRRSFIKIAAVSIVALAFVLLTTAPSFDPSSVSAVVDFRRGSLESFTFKGKFDGISRPANPNDLKITVSLENVTTGEIAAWQGTPTQVR